MFLIFIWAYTKVQTFKFQVKSVIKFSNSFEQTMEAHIVSL